MIYCRIVIVVVADVVVVVVVAVVVFINVCLFSHTPIHPQNSSQRAIPIGSRAFGSRSHCGGPPCVKLGMQGERERERERERETGRQREHVYSTHFDCLRARGGNCSTAARESQRSNALLELCPWQRCLSVPSLLRAGLGMSTWYCLLNDGSELVTRPAVSSQCVLAEGKEERGWAGCTGGAAL